jgi:hypothetical protein
VVMLAQLGSAGAREFGHRGGATERTFGTCASTR